jgi:hypothetical protein
MALSVMRANQYQLPEEIATVESSFPKNQPIPLPATPFISAVTPNRASGAPALSE